ncbi:hypothetical protein JCM9279_004637 [Rhodotorula babjevae]
MFDHQLDTVDRFVKHRKRAPQVVAAAATTAAAAAAQETTIRGHVSLITDGTSRGRTFIPQTVITLSDTAAAAAATTVAEEPTTTARTTAARATTTSAAPARTTTARAAATTASSSAAVVANPPASSSVASGSSSAARATGSSTSNAANGSASSKDDSSSGISGGAVAGIIIALLLVAAIGAGFFFWRRKRNARLARGSGTGLIGGRSPDMAGAGAGAGAYKKQHETGDSELFANSSASPMWNASANSASGEKPHDEYGAGSASSWPPPPPQSQQGQQRDSFVAPSFTSYPASSAAAGGQGWPNSTANLLGAAGVGTAAAVAGGERSMSPFADPHHESIEQREMQQELENQRQAQAAAAAAAAAAVAVPAASPFGESEGQGEVRIVKGTFVPNLDDELIFQPGDRVQVLMKYDDGWALGVNLSAGSPSAKGVFPFDCLGDVVDVPSSSAAAPAPLPAPVHPALQPGQLAKPVPSLQVETAAAPVNPANVPLPPPTPTGLEPISELSASAPVVSTSAPQLAPLSLSASTSLTAKGSKRASSLIASRDADLFVALGEVLDKKDRKDEDESLI